MPDGFPKQFAENAFLMEAISEADTASTDRADGAQLAGDDFWENQQRAAAARFAVETTWVQTLSSLMTQLMQPHEQELRAEYVDEIIPHVAGSGLPSMFVELLEERAFSTAGFAEELQDADPQVFQDGISAPVTRLVQAVASSIGALEDMVTAIQIRVDRLGEEIHDLTPVQLQQLAEARLPVEEDLDHTISTLGAIQSIRVYLDLVFALLDTTNNLDELRDDLELVLQAIPRLGLTDLSPQGFRDLIQAAEDVGELTGPTLASSLRTSQNAIEFILKEGLFDDYEAAIIEFKSLVTDGIGSGITNAAANQLLDHADFALAAFQGDLNVPAPQINIPAIARRAIFYANTSHDNVKNESSIPFHRALRENHTGDSPNISNFYGGINGVIVDLANATTSISTADFAFRVGRTDDTSAWDHVLATPSIEILLGEGFNGTDRIALTWPSIAIANTWLEVTVKANENTGLTEDDIFYFGSQIGDANGDGMTNAIDFALVRANPANFLNPADVNNAYDLNRDGRVNTIDMAIVRDNATGISDGLPMITPNGAVGKYLVLPESRKREASKSSTKPIQYELGVEAPIYDADRFAALMSVASEIDSSEMMVIDSIIREQGANKPTDLEVELL